MYNYIILRPTAGWAALIFPVLTNMTTVSDCQTSSSHIPGDEPEQRIDMAMLARLSEKGGFEEHNGKRQEKCQQPVRMVFVNKKVIEGSLDRRIKRIIVRHC